MDPELEALLKAWGAYDMQERGSEVDRLLSLYESRLTEVAAERKLAPEALHRAVKWAFAAGFELNPIHPECRRGPERELTLIPARMSEGTVHGPFRPTTPGWLRRPCLGITSHHLGRVAQKADAANRNLDLVAFLQGEQVRRHNAGSGQQHRTVGKGLTSEQKTGEFFEAEIGRAHV